MRYMVLLLVLASAPGCVYIDGEPDWSSREQVSLEPYRSVVLDGGFGHVFIEVCRECEPAVFMEERPAEPIRNGDVLVIDSGGVIARDSSDIKLVTTDLREVVLNGSGDVTIKGVFAPAFTAINNGSGSIDGEGDARDVTIVSTGSGEVDLRRISSKTATVSLNGSGDSEVCAFESIYGAVSGSGSLYYACHPDIVEVAVTGSGDVDPI